VRGVGNALISQGQNSKNDQYDPESSHKLVSLTTFAANDPLM
jgi:hypothetical protein